MDSTGITQQLCLRVKHHFSRKQMLVSQRYFIRSTLRFFKRSHSDTSYKNVGLWPFEGSIDITKLFFQELFFLKKKILWKNIVNHWIVWGKLKKNSTDILLSAALTWNLLPNAFLLNMTWLLKFTVTVPALNEGFLTLLKIDSKQGLYSICTSHEPNLLKHHMLAWPYLLKIPTECFYKK